jgi:DNA-binding MarR family transcriptional regulator
MTELATFLGLDKSTMSGLVDRAERRGLLERGKNPHDKRVIDVYLTPAGHELNQRLDDEIRRDLAPLVDRVAPQHRVELTQLLEPLLSPPLQIAARATTRN